jgi:ribosomal protein S18 acetylase RimI-like enzyme
MNSDLQQIYEKSFPDDERREWNQLIDILDDNRFTINGIYFQQQLIGIITFWNLDGFRFIEHFAIRNTEQGKGYGTQVIKKLTAEILVPVILEVEEPFTDVAKKRIAFYERLNFRISEQEYYQPPYSVGKNRVKMLLMSYPEKLDPNKFTTIKNKIYQTVYSHNE